MSKINKPYKKDIYDIFIEWSIMTNEEKISCHLATAKSFAKKYKVSEGRLSKWKKRAEFCQLKQEKLIDKLSNNTPDVLHALYKRCVKYGMAHDAELWLLYVEGWDKKHALLEIANKKLTLAPDDIRALVDRLPKEKRRSFYDTLTNLLVEAQEAVFND